MFDKEIIMPSWSLSKYSSPHFKLQKEFKTKSLTWWTDNLVILVINHGTGWSFFPYCPTNEVEQVEQNAPDGCLQCLVFHFRKAISALPNSQNGSISRFYHKHFFYGLSLGVNLAGHS
jgi:hypothetical protein